MSEQRPSYQAPVGAGLSARRRRHHRRLHALQIAPRRVRDDKREPGRYPAALRLAPQETRDALPRDDRDALLGSLPLLFTERLRAGRPRHCEGAKRFPWGGVLLTLDAPLDGLVDARARRWH
jgi:hypothetical protein